MQHTMDPDFVVVGYCNSCGRVLDYGRFRNKWRYFVNVWVACRKGSECQYNNGSQPWGMILMNVVQCISHKWYVKWGGTDERHVGLVGIYTYIYINARKMHTWEPPQQMKMQSRFVGYTETHTQITWRHYDLICLETLAPCVECKRNW